MSEPARVEIALVGGVSVVVDGTLEEVVRQLSDAARSGQSRLAWLSDVATGEQVGVNPAHVTLVRSSGASG